MNRLYVADVSCLLYSGHCIHKEKNIRGLPVGGLLGLTQWIATAIGAGDAILLAFDDKSFRKELYKGYKGSRAKDPAIEVQKEMAYEAALACNIQPHRYKGMEADDIMSWASVKLEGAYWDIDLLTNDMDVAHNVRNRITIHAVNSRGNCVTSSNFTQAVCTGQAVRWNTISVHKVLFGCKSDEIPPFCSKSGKSNKEIYAAFCAFLDANGIQDYSSSYRATFGKFLKETDLLTSEDLEDIVRRIPLIFPAPMPTDAVLLPSTKETVNHTALCQFLCALNDYHSMKCLGYNKEGVLPDTWRFFDRYRARYLSGEYSADNSLRMPERETAESELLDLDCLKEF